MEVLGGREAKLHSCALAEGGPCDQGQTDSLQPARLDSTAGGQPTAIQAKPNAQSSLDSRRPPPLLPSHHQTTTLLLILAPPHPPPATQLAT